LNGVRTFGGFSPLKFYPPFYRPLKTLWGLTAPFFFPLFFLGPITIGGFLHPFGLGAHTFLGLGVPYGHLKLGYSPHLWGRYCRSVCAPSSFFVLRGGSYGSKELGGGDTPGKRAGHHRGGPTLGWGETTQGGFSGGPFGCTG